MTAEHDRTNLRRIANALSVSIDYFFERPAETELTVGMEANLETVELLKAFANIADAQVRRECIEYVRDRQPKAPL